MTLLHPNTSEAYVSQPAPEIVDLQISLEGRRKRIDDARSTLKEDEQMSSREVTIKEEADNLARVVNPVCIRQDSRSAKIVQHSSNKKIKAERSEILQIISHASKGTIRYC